MAELKTRTTNASVSAFISAIDDTQMRADAKAVLDMMKDATGAKPKMWGPAIIGFGETSYKSKATGKEVDWFVMGFSPRKANLSLYLPGGVTPYAAALKKLGKYKTAVSCLYIRRLADVDLGVLKGIISSAVQ